MSAALPYLRAARWPFACLVALVVVAEKWI